MRQTTTNPDKNRSDDAGWGAAEGARVWVGGHNQPARSILEQRLTHTCRPPTGPLDAAFIVPRTIDEAVYFADKVSARLVDGGAIWLLSLSDQSHIELLRDDILLAHAEAMTTAGWRVAERHETDDELVAVRLKRIAKPARPIDPS